MKECIEFIFRCKKCMNLELSDFTQNRMRRLQKLMHWTLCTTKSRRDLERQWAAYKSLFLEEHTLLFYDAELRVKYHSLFLYDAVFAHNRTCTIHYMIQYCLCSSQHQHYHYTTCIHCFVSVHTEQYAILFDAMFCYAMFYYINDIFTMLY